MMLLINSNNFGIGTILGTHAGILDYDGPSHHPQLGMDDDGEQNSSQH